MIFLHCRNHHNNRHANHIIIQYYNFCLTVLQCYIAFENGEALCTWTFFLFIEIKLRPAICVSINQACMISISCWSDYRLHICFPLFTLPLLLVLREFIHASTHLLPLSVHWDTALTHWTLKKTMTILQAISIYIYMNMNFYLNFTEFSLGV